jgi:hypothetical protein
VKPDERLPTPAGGPAQPNYEALVAAIAPAHDRAQRQAVQGVNLALTLRNWLIGYHIVESQQHGSDHARYGERLLDTLAHDLRRRLGMGFARRNLFLFREFYLRYPIVQSVLRTPLPVLDALHRARSPGRSSQARVLRNRGAEKPLVRARTEAPDG